MANFYKKSQFAGGGAQPEKAQSGRSMIEMLGVLAIIGVLSLVSISAYSKAMAKYQLNQHAEALSSLLNSVISLLPDFQRQYGKASEAISLAPIFNATSMLPAGMNYNPMRNSVEDIFKNTMRITYTLDPGGTTEYYMSFNLGSDGDRIAARNRGVCLNIMMIAQQNAANIYAIDMRSYKEEGGSVSGARLTGGTYRSGNKSKRLATATLNDLSDACDSCNSTKNCNITLYIDVRRY